MIEPRLLPGTLQSGNHNFVVFDRNDKVGGYCWITAANKGSKLQTEFGSFHIWWGQAHLAGCPSRPEKVVPTTQAGQDCVTEKCPYPKGWEIWPKKEKVLEHFHYAAEAYGVLPNFQFKTNVAKMDIVGDKDAHDRYYKLSVHPVDGGDTREVNVSLIYNYPGCMTRNRIIDYPGEDVFGGHVAYGMNDDCPYHELKGQNVAILGNGAFAVSPGLLLFRARNNVTTMEPVESLPQLASCLVSVPFGSSGVTLREFQRFNRGGGERWSYVWRLRLGDAASGLAEHQKGLRKFSQKPPAEVSGRVSVLTPTTASRARFHEQLWQCFVDQTWPDKDLVVVETYNHNQHPSEVFTKLVKAGEKRLKYLAIEVDENGDFTVGAKRNLTVLMSSGQYCVHFDDDDLYAGVYVERMVNEVRQRGLVALTLSAWHNFFESRDRCGYSTPGCWEPEDHEEYEGILYGYGFSYVYLRALALYFPYPNLAFAEDAPFMLKLREKMGASRVGLKEDVEGLCLHIVHSTSSTPDPAVEAMLTEGELNGLVVSESTACFIGVRVGDVLKQGRYEPQRCYNFPQLDRRRNAKVDIYQHVGTCMVAVDPDTKATHEVAVSSLDPETPASRIKIHVQAMSEENKQQREQRTKVKPELTCSWRACRQQGYSHDVALRSLPVISCYWSYND
eukprot:s2088_g1.t1